MFGIVTYCLIMLALVIGAWRRPVVGFAAVLCLYGLKQWGQSSSAFFAIHREFTNFAVFFIALFGVLREAQKRGCVLCEVPTTTVLVLALYADAIVSILWSLDPGAAVDQWIALGPYVVTIALLAPLLFTNFEDARVAFVWTACVGAVICFLALVFGSWGARGLVIYGYDIVTGNGEFYEYETNPLALSSVAGSVVVITSFWFSKPNRPAMRALALICILVGVAVMLKTGTRGQLIATGFALLIASPIAFKLTEARSIASFFGAAVLIGGLAFWAISIVDFDTSRWESSRTAGDVVGRLDNAVTLLSVSSASIGSVLFGLGNSSAFKVLGIYPHVTGLEVVAEEGILGGVLYFGILALAVRSIRRILARPDFDELKRNVLATLTGLSVFELIISWKQGSLLISVYVFAYAMVLARLESAELSVQATDSAPAGAGLTVATPFPNLLR
jgi:hypothetical protein